MGARAIISDIHGNLEALRTVLDYTDKLDHVDEVACLGDIVGYGPWPKECVDTIRERCEWCLCGNHDVALLSQAFGFNDNGFSCLGAARESNALCPFDG